MKELSWPPRIAARGGQSTSLKPLPPHPLSSSHPQAPVIITAGRPIVILPNDYIHSRCDFPPGASLSAGFSLQPQSLGCFRDPIPAPIITPVDNDYAGPTPAPVVTPIDDDCPSVEHMVPIRQFGGAKAIEFTDNKECIVPGQPEVDPHNKEESTLCTGKQASPVISCDNTSKPQQLNAIQKSPFITDFGVTRLPRLPNSDESADSTIAMLSQNTSSNSPLSLGAESGNKAQNLEQLQLPVQKSSSVRVSPLIMTCYEESKEQLVLDDSDSELEMPEYSRSASCTPQHSAEQSTSESGTEDQVHDSSIDIPPPKEEIPDADIPLPKRAKMAETSTTDSDTPAISEYHCTLTGSGENQDLDPHSPIAKESSTVVTESSENFGQTVPNKSPLFADCEPLEAAEPTKISSTLASTVPDHSFKLECPHEPEDVANDGKDTIDQILPMESSREHAMVPNLVRCADSNQLNNDRDDPGDDSTHLKAYASAVDLHSSCLENIEGVQTRMGDNLVPGQTVVEQKMEAGIQVPELHEDALSQRDPVNSADIDISAKPQTDLCIPSLVVPSTMESAQLHTEHQIVPEEFTANNALSSSQSLYTDRDFHECKPSPQLQKESSVDDPRVLAVSLDSIEKRWSIAASLSHLDDQALPDLESPSQLTQHYTESDSPVVGSGVNNDEQRGSSGQSFGPFGFRLGKHTPCPQSKLQCLFCE